MRTKRSKMALPSGGPIGQGYIRKAYCDIAFGKDAPMNPRRTPEIKLHVGESPTEAWAKLAAAYGPVVTFLRGKKGYLDPAKRDARHDVYTGLLRRVRKSGVRNSVDKLVNYLVLSTNRRYGLNSFLLGRLILLGDLPEKARPAKISMIFDPARIALAREEARLVYEEVAKLPAPQRKIVKMRSQGASHTRAAQVLGVTPGNARGIYHAAIKTLRRRFSWAA